jgi:hypothetical protein
MPASTILSQVRTPLATALASVAGNVYSYVPETIIPPAVVVVPDTPYLELETISKSTLHVKINFTISVAVAYNSNPASLDNIEQLIMSVLAVIPTGYVVSVVERPTVTQVGASTLLIADVRVSTYYTQTT